MKFLDKSAINTNFKLPQIFTLKINLNCLENFKTYYMEECRSLYLKSELSSSYFLSKVVQ